MYRKIIHYGDTLELYEYEKHPSTGRKRTRPIPFGGTVSDVSDDRAVVSEQAEPKKVRLPQSGQRAILGFKRLVAANMGGVDKPIFATFTYSKNFKDLKGARADFNAFAKRLKGQFGEHVRYVVVAEFQRRGAIHFHSLLWGLPIEVVALERDSRLVAGLWGHGFADLMSVRSPQAIGVYLSKYLYKTFLDPRLSGMKAYIGSRNLIKPVVDKNALLTPYLYGHGFNLKKARLLHEKEYLTKWFGRGSVKIYKLL